MTIASTRRRIPMGVAALSTAAVLLSTAFSTAAVAAPDKTQAQVNLPPVLQVSVNSGQEELPTDQFIVQFDSATKGNPGERGKAYGKIAKETGVTVKEVKATATGAQVVKANRALNADESKKVLERLQSLSNVQYAEADIILQPSLTPNDPHYPNQWNLWEAKAGLNLPAVWDKTTGAGQTVAVLDSGITSHSDLNGNMVAGYDMIIDTAKSRDGNGRDANPQDEGDYRAAGECGSTTAANSSWHGTHVAGTIAAAGNNATGVTGAAYGVKVQMVRTLGACGGYLSDSSDGIIWASGGAVTGVPANATPAQTINLSLGGTGTCSTTMQNAINSAASRGATVVVAAGNSNVNASNQTPANCANVITVASTTRDGGRAPYSNYGSVVDVAAPGGASGNGILATWNSGTTTPGAEAYGYMIGTSMATPQVSAVAALAKAADPSLTPAAIESRIKSTTRILPIACAEGCGTGLVDASKAVVFPTAPAPAPTPTPAPTTSTITGATPTISGTAKVGYSLTANPGTWGPAPVALSYQWFRSGVAITGATASTYKLTSSDLSKIMSVRVTGAKSGYTSVAKTSASTAAVAAGTLSGSTPTISGTLKAGYTLTATPGAWTAGTTLKYQWYRSGYAISGATASTYTLTSLDRLDYMSVRVTGSQPGYTSLTKASANTTRVP